MRITIINLSVVGLIFTACLDQAFANPTGGSVLGGGGNATITGQGTTFTTINQSANQVIINWQSFSIGAGEITRFVQPSATASALNRIISGNPSLIYGSLQANGRVFVINPNGIIVGPGGQIDTKSFVASTLNVSDASFLAGGKLSFTGDSTASIKNYGTISALGGDVFLIANMVENNGTINAPKGTVGLAAGSTIQLVQSGNERLSVLAGNSSASGTPVGVNNIGTINASSAELKAAGGNIYALAINNGGVIRATGIVQKNGHIYLAASGGNIQNSGTLAAKNADGSGGTIILDGGHNATDPSTVTSSGTVDATSTSAGTQGGLVEIFGDNVGLFNNALVDVSGDAGGGTALIGGDTHGANPDVPNAQQTTVDPGTTINASALTEGNGGKVVVWADDTTIFGGQISARGGATGGNGGFAEVSGRQNLSITGHADLTAPHGVAGELLLDPGSVDIVNGANTPPPATMDTFNDGWVNAQLGLGSLTIDTANANNANPATLTVDAGAAIAWNSANNLDLIGNNSVTISGTIANTGTGNLTLQSGSGPVILNGTVNIAADLGISAGTTVAFDASTTVGGNLTVTAAGPISQTAAIVANGSGATATFAAGSGNNITLNNAGNNFKTVAIGSGDNVMLRDANAIILGASTVSGNLGVTANGPITQSGALTVNGAGATATFAAGSGNNITLNNAGNDFTTVVIGSGDNVALLDANAIDLGASTVSGNLGVTVGGDITQSGALNVTSGSSTFTDNGVLLGNVLLGSYANNFAGQTVTISGGSIQDVAFRNISGSAAFSHLNLPAGLRNLTLQFDGAAITFPALTLSGNLTVTANGITDSGAIIVPGTTTLAAGSGNNITLNNNDDFGTVFINSGKTVTLNDLNAIDLGASTVSGNLNVTANGPITQSGGALTVNGATATFAAGSGNDITLNNAGNDFTTVAIGSGNNVTLNDLNAIDLGASTVSGNLGVTANGPITQSGALTVNGATATFAAGSGNNITLNNAGNNFTMVAIGSGDNVALRDANAIDLGASTVSGTLNITANGPITQSGALTVNGASATATFAAGSGNDITLNNAGNDFTTVAIGSGNNVTLNDLNAIDLGASTVSGNLGVTANGPITQSGALTVNGATATFAAGSGNNITLNNAGNNFKTVAIGSGDNVMLRDANAIILGASTVSGNLGVTANGPITQSGALTVNGAGATATFAAGSGNNITLNNAGNDFTTVVIGSGDNVALLDANAIDLGASTVSGNLGVTVGGDITQSGALNVTSGSSTFTDNGVLLGNVLLGSYANNFAGQTVTISGGSIQDVAFRNISGSAAFSHLNLPAGLRNLTLQFDGAAITFPALTLSGNLTVTANGPITQGGALTVNGAGATATFAGGSGNNITLNNAGNDFTTVAIGSGNNVTLNDLNAIDLGASTVSGTLNITANGPITQSGALTVNGATATFAAGSGNNITLNNAGNNFKTVAIGSGDNVTLADANAIILGGSTMSGNLNVTANGSITQSGALTVNGASATATFAAGSGNNITLNNAGNNFTTVAIGSGDNVALLDANAIDLGASTVSGTLNITANGPITQSGALTVNGATATFAAGSGNNITLNNAGNNFKTVAIGSGDNVTLADANAIILGGSTMSGNLNVTANGPITQSGALTVNGASATATFAAGSGNNITLNNAGNNFTTVAIGSGDNVTLQDANAIILGASTVSGNLGVTANGPITQSGALTVNGAGSTATFATGPADDITLNDPNNDFMTVAISAGGRVAGHNVTLNDINGLNLGEIDISGILIVTIAGISTVQLVNSVAELSVVYIPMPRLEDTINYASVSISLDEAAKILPPGSIGTLWMQLPFPPPENYDYKVEDMSKWTSGHLATAGGTTGLQSSR